MVRNSSAILVLRTCRGQGPTANAVGVLRTVRRRCRPNNARATNALSGTRNGRLSARNGNAGRGVAAWPLPPARATIWVCAGQGTATKRGGPGLPPPDLLKQVDGWLHFAGGRSRAHSDFRH